MFVAVNKLDCLARDKAAQLVGCAAPARLAQFWAVDAVKPDLHDLVIAINRAGVAVVNVEHVGFERLRFGGE